MPDNETEQVDLQLEQAIGFNLNRAAFVMREEIARRFSEAGYPLTAQDFGILYRLNRQDGLTQTVIAALMMRDKTTITRRLDTLVRKGFIERRPDQQDRRRFCIHLTDTGRHAVPALSELVAAFQQEVLNGISEADRRATFNTLKNIVNYVTRSRK